MKILHVFPALGQGGAERVASELVAHRRDGMEHVFVSMVPGAPFFPMEQVRIETLGLGRGQLSPKAALAFRAIMKREKPDIVQGWLYHGNALACLALGLGPRILWSIHNTSLNAAGSKGVTRFLNRAAAPISFWIPDRVIYCAEAARAFHENLGYDPKRSVVIPNGVDLERFKPSAPIRAVLRDGLGLGASDFVLGHFGRLDAQKGIPILLAALRLLIDQKPHARLILAGAGFEPENAEIRWLLDELPVGTSVSLLGARNDIPDLLSAIDVLVIASTFGEALPMIALEAAAAGLPVVTTDIGEAKRLALSPRHVVRPNDPEGLAHAIGEAWADITNGALIEAVGRRRALLEEQFGVGRMVQSYNDLYWEVDARGRQGPQPASR